MIPFVVSANSIPATPVPSHLGQARYGLSINKSLTSGGGKAVISRQSPLVNRSKFGLLRLRLLMGMTSYLCMVNMVLVYGARGRADIL